MGASIFPDTFRVLVATGRAGPTVTPLLYGRVTGLPKFIGPATANVVGSAKDITKAIIIVFMTRPCCSFSPAITWGHLPDPSTKRFFRYIPSADFAQQ